MECIEKIIKKDMIDPTNGKKITDKDIIPLERVCSENAKFPITKQKTIQFYSLFLLLKIPSYYLLHVLHHQTYRLHKSCYPSFTL